uniref:Uncharacterized protein n=1 Tax=Solanum tuberosum TaxID=4113 RepID=M1DAN2_SOLTU
MMFRDRILTFKQLEGERIHEACARLKSLLIRCPTHEIPDIVLLDYFYRSLGPGNKALVDQLIPGGITQQPYVIAAHLLDLMVESNQEVEKDFMLATLMTQMDKLDKNIVELEVQCKRKDKYVPPHERGKPKDNEGKRVEGMLSIILNKLQEICHPDKQEQTNFRRNTKSTNPPKTDNETKKPSASKRTNPRDPTIPSWRHGFFTAIHSFLAAHDLDNLSQSTAAESSEEAPEAIIKFQADTSGTDAQTYGAVV